MTYNFIKRFEECIYEEQIYLNPKLTLTDLALKVGTNRTYLSNYINHELKKTFFDFINSLRLDFATQLLLNTNLTLEVIAEKSGFNSLSTFRRYFMYVHKVSPTVYKRENVKFWVGKSWESDFSRSVSPRDSFIKEGFSFVIPLSTRAKIP